MDMGNQVSQSTTVNQTVERDAVESPTVRSDETACGKLSEMDKTQTWSCSVNVPEGPTQRRPSHYLNLASCRPLRSESAQPRLQQNSESQLPTARFLYIPLYLHF